MKTQMKFQKLICLLTLIAGAIAIAYAFFYCTGGLVTLSQAKSSIDGFTPVDGKNGVEVYDNVQGFNNLLVTFGIIIVLIAVALYATATSTRRNYYLDNYIVISVAVVALLVISAIAIAMNAGWEAQFRNVDFATWRETNAEFEQLMGLKANSLPYSESTLWFSIGYVVYGFVILCAIAQCLNLLWKIKLMKGEKELLERSAEKRAQINAEVE